MGTGSGHSQPRKAAAELKRHAVNGHPKNTARTEHRQETGEAGESRQPFTPRLRGKFPNDVRNGRFRPVLEQVSWGCCTVNKIRWFSITV